MRNKRASRRGTSDRLEVPRYGLSLIRLRESVRALIVDQDERVLLVRFDWPGLEPAGGFWANPGGGIEPGESRLAALQRELREETGLVIHELGPEIWTKTALFEMSDWDGQIDHVHLFRIEHFEPAPAMTSDELVAENVHEIRWWSEDEIDASTATFAPRVLPALLRELRSGVPDAPIALTGF